MGIQAERRFEKASNDSMKIIRDKLDKLISVNPLFSKKFNTCGLRPSDIQTIDDFQQLPFTTKDELRESYPFGFMAVPQEEVIRIHSSSGTTGKPVIIPYTAQDVADWRLMMARAMRMAGVTRKDRVQITPGYGLWTAGIGFQAGVEEVGAMAVPTGPGNTEKQLEMLVDIGTTVLIGTSSYGLLLAEEMAKRGLDEHIKLKKGIFGSERWGDKTRERIEDIFGIETYDIYGLTEIYGPGIAIDCHVHDGMHYWDDYFIFEVIDPVTGKNLPDGEQGELVITTLHKEGLPLIRYRTRDLTRIIPGGCACGSAYPRIERILARTDDMIKVKGVNIYPGQLDHVIKNTLGLAGEYQIVINRFEGKDNITIKAEKDDAADTEITAKAFQKNIKTVIGIHADVEIVSLGTLPRSEKKTKRVYDNRE